jgi:hypothetical protein
MSQATGNGGKLPFPMLSDASSTGASLQTSKKLKIDTEAINEPYSWRGSPLHYTMMNIWIKRSEN